MPGIENLAPERTLTSSGFAAEPNVLPGFDLEGGDGGEDVLPQSAGQLFARCENSRCKRPS